MDLWNIMWWLCIPINFVACMYATLGYEQYIKARVYNPFAQLPTKVLMAFLVWISASSFLTWGHWW